VATNRLMSGPLALSPLEFLFRMSPLALLQSLLYAYLSGEVSSFRLATPRSTTSLFSSDFLPPLYNTSLPITHSRYRYIAILAINGIHAFALNVSSFSTNKKAGALTMTVCGNLKQCLTIFLGILIFRVHVGWSNAHGMVSVLAGAAWYGVIELGTWGENGKKKRRGSRERVRNTSEWLKATK
jgi:hypothetical protein